MIENNYSYGSYSLLVTDIVVGYIVKHRQIRLLAAYPISRVQVESIPYPTAS